MAAWRRLITLWNMPSRIEPWVPLSSSARQSPRCFCRVTLPDRFGRTTCCFRRLRLIGALSSSTADLAPRLRSLAYTVRRTRLMTCPEGREECRKLYIPQLRYVRFCGVRARAKRRRLRVKRRDEPGCQSVNNSHQPYPGKKVGHGGIFLLEP